MIATVPATGARVEPVPAVLTIKKSFFSLSCVVRTDELASHSVAEGFVMEADRQIEWLTYAYTSKPRITLAGRSNPHDSATVLEVIQNPEAKLVGKYWTDRKTTGELNFRFHSRELLEELPCRHQKTPNDAPIRRVIGTRKKLRPHKFEI